MAEILQTACIITVFVFVMMLIVEYLNAVTGSVWQRVLLGGRWKQYVFAGIMGASPGCLGTFVVFTLYAHGALSLGAMITAAVATFGDEEFVLLALAPKTALLLGIGLGAIGILAGVVVDLLHKHQSLPSACIKGIAVHPEQKCSEFSWNQFLRLWRACTMARFLLVSILVVLLFLLLTGGLGGQIPAWLRYTLVATIAAALVIAIFTNDHFLEEHLWHHIALRHVPRIFAWTLLALVIMHFLTARLDVGPVLQRNRWIVLATACLVGIIPESGPHLLFVTLYAQGAAPLSVLVGSSIVQDGHGLLPVLAHSRKDFVIIKAVALAVGLGVGGAMMAIGF
jgi:hypothetical protein